MTQHLKIDFVSDVACPWCVIGLRGLQQALANAADAVEADIPFQPFELNPGMPAGGQNLGEHITEKYGSTAEQSAASRAMIRSRGAEVGFTFNMSEESRIYNTFDAHRLLHLALERGVQRDLKTRLGRATFTDGDPIEDHDTLRKAAADVGLDPQEVDDVLAGDAYAADVLTDVATAHRMDVTGVPFFLVDGRLALSGAQPPELLGKVLQRAWDEAHPEIERIEGLAGGTDACGPDGCPI